jgi:hypothetical protein
MANIRQQLERVKDPKRAHLIQFTVSTQQDRIINYVSKAYEIPKSEFIRRCINYVLSRETDRSILDAINEIKEEPQT